MSSILSTTVGHGCEKVTNVSLGMIVLDELRLPGRDPLYDVPGGSGLYSTVGSRLVLSEDRSKEVGCIVMAGRDFPDAVLDLFRRWDLNLLVHKDPTRLPTRGLLQYEGDDFNKKTFKYVTPPIQPTPNDLKGSALLGSLGFHFLASPEDMEMFIPQLLELRAAEGISTRPLLVWEPAPLSCVAGSRDAHLRAAKLVDVYSPNHQELMATFQSEEESNENPAPDFDYAVIERYASEILESGVGPAGEGVVIVRCGAHGSLAVSRTYPSRRFPAFHDGASQRVADATGAGNCFLGGFMATFGELRDLTQAMISASVAASFAVEQIGPPKVTTVDGMERWNEEEFPLRVREYQQRITGRD